MYIFILDGEGEALQSRYTLSIMAQKGKKHFPKIQTKKSNRIWEKNQTSFIGEYVTMFWENEAYISLVIVPVCTPLWLKPLNS